MYFGQHSENRTKHFFWLDPALQASAAAAAVKSLQSCLTLCDQASNVSQITLPLTFVGTNSTNAHILCLNI